MKKVFQVLILLMLACPCLAFNPEKQHKPLTQKAVSVYQVCTRQILSPELAAAFVEGAVDEDEFGCERLGNWHFYNNGGRIGDYYFIFHGANDRIFAKRINQLNSLLGNEKAAGTEIYKVAGRIAHHIQDMNSPPHVMPIYHLSCDQFDKYTPSCTPVQTSAECCKTLDATVIQPETLFERAVQNTRRAVKGPVEFDHDKPVKNETWMKFWGGHENKHLAGFGTYGEYGNVFGRVPPCSSPVCQAYSSDTYKHFFNERYEQAVMDTVHVLIYLDRRMNSANRPRRQ